MVIVIPVNIPNRTFVTTLLRFFHLGLETLEAEFKDIKIAIRQTAVKKRELTNRRTVKGARVILRTKTGASGERKGH